MLPGHRRGECAAGWGIVVTVDAAVSILTGCCEPIARAQRLRAGPLTMLFESGDLRYIRLGDREVVRRIYVAVRDRNWRTVPARLSELTIEQGDNSFRIRYIATHLDGPIHFVWTAVIEGDGQGRVRFAMDGRALSDFQRCRIGFCVLHPLRECAGMPCRLTHADGRVSEVEFPRFVAPTNPFLEVVGMSHEVLPGVRAALEFEGDLFETEDQRNWADGSFKTFCTPLRLPFPVEVKAGAEVRQAATLTIQGTYTSFPERSTTTRFCVDGEVRGQLTEIGLCVPEDGSALSDSQARLLREVRPAHLRLDVEPRSQGWEGLLRRAVSGSCLVGCPIEVGILTDEEQARNEFADVVRTVRELSGSVARWVIHPRTGWTLSDRLVEEARGVLERFDPGVPLTGGTRANFRELNCAATRWDRLDGLCFAAHPQEHAFDNLSLIENLEGLAAAMESARRIAAGLPVEVGPVTLRRRVNPYATGPERELGAGELPARVDPRQMSLFGAVWTLGAIKHLAEQGAPAASFYETVGWLGLMEREEGPALPNQFPSRPAQVFPMYHVLADVNEFRGGEVLSGLSSAPLAADGLVVRMGDRMRVMLANFMDEPTEVVVDGVGSSVRVRVLDKSNALQDADDAQRFRHAPRRRVEARQGMVTIGLDSYAYATIDCE